MNNILISLVILLFGACTNDSTEKVDLSDIPVTSSIVLDSDCDGVTDDLDLCPGINDLIDNNNDGKPDCKFPPALADIIPAWKCSGGTKVQVCTKTPSGGFKTVCTYYSALQTHINNGGFLGICGSAKCN